MLRYRAIRVEGRVLACRSKANDNKRLPKKICYGFIILFVHANFKNELL